MDLKNDNFFTKRYLKLAKKRVAKVLKKAVNHLNNYHSYDYNVKFYKNDPKINEFKNLKMENKDDLMFSDYHKPQDIIVSKHDPVKIQKLKEKIQKKVYYVDNYVLKNYLSAWSMINQKIEPPKIKYSLDVKVDPRVLFKANDDVFGMADMYANQIDYLDNNKNECLFTAIATAIAPYGKESNTNYVRIAKDVKRDAIRAALNNGNFHDYLVDGKKNTDYVEDLLDEWKIGMFILDEEEYKKGNLKKVESFAYQGKQGHYIFLLKNGNHLDVLRKKEKGKYGSNAEVKYQNSCMPNGRIIERRCIDRKLYEENIVHLASIKKDKFVCPLFKDLNAYTSYEEFCKQVPCTCQGNMTFAFGLNDQKRDNNVIYYDQCPRIQIIAALRQILPQNPYDEKLVEKLEKFCDKLFDEREIDELIKKHFEKIDYARWLQRCKPKYRRQILNYLKDHDDWKIIKEPNLVNGMIKEECQDVGDKARGLGAPTILHKMLMGPIESNFENLFRELFPDFWGVGESMNQKEFELNELAERLHADKSITLDVSGLDQSHNLCVKLFWRKILDKVCDYLETNPNCAFSPKSIKAALDKHSTVLLYFNKDYKRRKENKSDTDSDSQYSVIIEIVEKMASGQGYTTVLNTSLMCFLMEYIKDEYYMNVGGKISGDDVALVTSDCQDKWAKVLGYIFSKKGANNKGGVGLVLKYFRYGELDAISPCSLLAFVCPNHGLRLVRQYQRYLKNFFYSQKMLNLPDALRMDFFATVCQGERFWSNGYRAFNMINNWPKPKRSVIKLLSEIFSVKTGKKKKAYYFRGKQYKEEDLAECLFEDRNIKIEECKYWDQKMQFLMREAGWIRNETLDSMKKIPVYPCCSEALDEKLASINPNLLDLDVFDYMYAAEDIDKYYDDLNKKVDYTLLPIDEKDRFAIYSYEDVQEIAEDKENNEFYYENKPYKYQDMINKIRKNYVEDMMYFKKKINAWKKYFIA